MIKNGLSPNPSPKERGDNIQNVTRIPFYKFVSFCIVLLLPTIVVAQDVDYKELNWERISTNQTRMIVLGSWGAANLAGGLVGYATANTQEWKAFHGMNAIWGGVNALIAVGGYAGARKEAEKEYNFDQAYDRYKATKRLYLINAGLDVLYIGTGIALDAASANFKNPQMWSGFGKSIAMQGVALLIFDGVMYGVHQRDNKQWVKALSGLTVGPNRIGYTVRL